jgi:hypothetical protein
MNRCNKANVNIMKGIDPKFIPFHKMCEASDGPKYLYKTSPKALKFSPSHLSYFSDSISFDVFLGALSLSTSTPMDSRGFTSDISYHGCTITRGLRLKQSLYQQVNKTKIAIPNNHSHLQFRHGLPRVYKELQLRHEVFTIFV